MTMTLFPHAQPSPQPPPGLRAQHARWDAATRGMPALQQKQEVATDPKNRNSDEGENKSKTYVPANLFVTWTDVTLNRTNPTESKAQITLNYNSANTKRALPQAAGKSQRHQRAPIKPWDTEQTEGPESSRGRLWANVTGESVPPYPFGAASQ